MNDHKPSTLPIISTPIQKQDVALLESLPVAQPLLRGNLYLGLEQHGWVLLFGFTYMGDATWALLCLVSLGVCDASMWPCHFWGAFCWVTTPTRSLVYAFFWWAFGFSFTLGANMTTAAMSILYTSCGAHAHVFLFLEVVEWSCCTLGGAATQFYKVVAQPPSHQQCEGSYCSTPCRLSTPSLQMRKTKR